MVIFNEVRLTEDKTSLVVDCSVEALDIYNSMYINTIYVDYYKNVTTAGVPSEKARKIYDRQDDTQNRQSVRRCLNETSISIANFGTDVFEGGLFYVIVNCAGSLPASAATYSCRADNTQDIAIVPDWKMLYQHGMGHVARLAMSASCNCEDGAGLEQFALLWNAIRLAIAACDYKQVEKLWDKFLGISSGNGVASSISCGCRG